MEVHRRLGHGFLEAVYQEALEIELTHREIPFRRQVELPIRYRDTILRTFYVADFVGYDSVIVELKALSAFDSVHEAQVINYLKATGLTTGVLINFGAPSLEYRRLIFSAASTTAQISTTIESTDDSGG